MNKAIGSIAWPSDARDSIHLLQRFMLEVVERLGIAFDPLANDPRVIVRGILSGELGSAERRSALAYWWSIVDEKGIRDLQSRDALVARLAICLLSPSEDEAWNLSEQLSWFIEVLGFLGADVDNAIDAMEKHFNFASR